VADSRSRPTAGLKCPSTSRGATSSLRVPGDGLPGVAAAEVIVELAERGSHLADGGDVRVADRAGTGLACLTGIAGSEPAQGRGRVPGHAECLRHHLAPVRPGPPQPGDALYVVLPGLLGGPRSRHLSNGTGRVSGRQAEFAVGGVGHAAAIGDALQDVYRGDLASSDDPADVSLFQADGGADPALAGTGVLGNELEQPAHGPGPQRGPDVLA
jgi:hypothetical protein